ncbi:hypothetical protein D3C78_1687340 [compost metagenome]
MVGTDQHQATEGRHQQQQVEFFTVAGEALGAFTEIGVSQCDAGQRGHQYDGHVQAGELVDGD